MSTNTTTIPDFASTRIPRCDSGRQTPIPRGGGLSVAHLAQLYPAELGEMPTEGAIHRQVQDMLQAGKVKPGDEMADDLYCEAYKGWRAKIAELQQREQRNHEADMAAWNAAAGDLPQRQRQLQQEAVSVMWWHYRASMADEAQQARVGAELAELAQAREDAKREAEQREAAALEAQQEAVARRQVAGEIERQAAAREAAAALKTSKAQPPGFWRGLRSRLGLDGDYRGPAAA